MCKNCLHVWHVYDYLFVDFVRYHVHALDTYVTFSSEIRLNDNHFVGKSLAENPKSKASGICHAAEVSD